MKIMKFVFLLNIILCSTSGWTQIAIRNNGADITNLSNIYIKGSYTNNGSGRIANGGTIYLTNDITNNSDTTLFVTNAGKVVLNGITQQNISGTREIYFYDLEVNKPNGKVVLSNNIKVDDTLNMVSGNINLNGKFIDLNLNGTLANERNSSRVYGSSGLIKAKRYLGSPVITQNIAGLGIYIASEVTDSITRFERSHYEQNSNGDTSIFRFYNIFASDSFLIDSLKISYFDAEAIPVESTYKIYSSVDNGVTWRNKGGKVDTVNNYILSSTVAPPALKNFSVSVFPIENFATCPPNDPNYISAIFLIPTEVENKDSVHFAQLSSPVPTDYVWDFGDLSNSTVDYDPVHVYHLQVDSIATAYLTSLKVSNGICTDTRKKKILVKPTAAPKVGYNGSYIGFEKASIYPNPNTGAFSLEIETTNDTEVTISIMDLQGKALDTRKVNASKLKEGYDLSNFDSGMYYIKVQAGEEFKVLKMVKM